MEDGILCPGVDCISQVEGIKINLGMENNKAKVAPLVLLGNKILSTNNDTPLEE